MSDAPECLTTGFQCGPDCRFECAPEWAYRLAAAYCSVACVTPSRHDDDCVWFDTDRRVPSRPLPWSMPPPPHCEWCGRAIEAWTTCDEESDRSAVSWVAAKDRRSDCEVSDDGRHSPAKNIQSLRIGVRSQEQIETADEVLVRISNLAAPGDGGFWFAVRDESIKQTGGRSGPVYVMNGDPQAVAIARFTDRLRKFLAEAGDQP